MSFTVTPEVEEAQRITNDVFLYQIEQFVCINEHCQANIPGSHVISEHDKRTGLRTITAVCPHCTTVARAPFILNGGRWHLAGNVERVTQPGKVRAAHRRVEARTNVTFTQSA